MRPMANVKLRNDLGYWSAGFVSTFSLDGIMEHLPLRWLQMLLVFPGEYSTLTLFLFVKLFCLANDHGVHVEAILLDKLVFLDTEE